MLVETDTRAVWLPGYHPPALPCLGHMPKSMFRSVLKLESQIGLSSVLSADPGVSIRMTLVNKEGRPISGVQPLLKWAGGKRQLLPQLRRFYPLQFRRYIEPFFGSGAVFFDLHRAGRLDGRDVILIDSNADLIGCYQSVRDDPDAVAAALDELATAHARRGDAHYYEVRDRRFNPLRRERRRKDGHIEYTPELAGMLIYLNRAGFNGLFRVNASGGFNVPAGRYSRPPIVDLGKLRGVATALSNPRLILIWGSFEAVETLADRGDFLYIDPPYAPLSPTASFTGYTTPRFDAKAQQRLQTFTITAARRGCHVLLSNSTAPEIRALYETSAEARAAGLRTIRVPARRAINRNASDRGSIDEFLITNIAADAEGVA
jgi:DNA adenine methylase